MNRIDRLLSLLIFLQSRKYVSAEAIAEKFGMSMRTVYRDLKALGETGVPISFEPGKGYCIVPGYFLPPVSFTMEEANALLLLEPISKAFGDNSISKHYTQVLHKVRSVLKYVQKDQLEELEDRIHLQLPSGLESNFAYLESLQQAIQLRKIVRISYENSRNETSSREIEPIGLIFYALSWHVIGWCHLRKEYRDFKVRRIRKLQDTQRDFTIPDHLEMRDYLKKIPVSY